MKKNKLQSIISTLFIFIIDFSNVSAQIQDPVHWSYGLKKISENIYEVHLLAKLDKKWHIYAQQQSSDAVAIPTKIQFNETSDILLIGKPIEFGKKIRFKVKELGITNTEYSEKVDFVQRIKIKTGMKEINGTISYQVCTELQCLPKNTINFSVPVP